MATKKELENQLEGTNALIKNYRQEDLRSRAEIKDLKESNETLQSVASQNQCTINEKNQKEFTIKQIISGQASDKSKVEVLKDLLGVRGPRAIMNYG